MPTDSCSLRCCYPCHSIEGSTAGAPCPGIHRPRFHPLATSPQTPMQWRDSNAAYLKRVMAREGNSDQTVRGEGRQPTYSTTRKEHHMYTLIDFRTNARLVRSLAAALGLVAGLAFGSVAAHAGSGDDYWQHQRDQQAQQDRQRQEEAHRDYQRRSEENSQQWNRQQEMDLQRRQEQSKPYTFTTPQGGSLYCQKSGSSVFCQ